MWAMGAAIIGPRYIHCGTRMVEVSSVSDAEVVSLAFEVEADVVVVLPEDT